MNIEKSIEILKEFRNYNKFYKEENKDLTITITLEAKESIDKAIERLLTAYEKEKELLELASNMLDNIDYDQIPIAIGELKAELEKEKETSHYNQSQLDIANAKLIEEKEKNKNIDEFCRKELAFERRLKRENREPDEFNQGRFYVAENIRKIIEEE